MSKRIGETACSNQYIVNVRSGDLLNKAAKTAQSTMESVVDFTDACKMYPADMITLSLHKFTGISKFTACTAFVAVAVALAFNIDSYYPVRILAVSAATFLSSTLIGNNRTPVSTGRTITGLMNDAQYHRVSMEGLDS